MTQHRKILAIYGATLLIANLTVWLPETSMPRIVGALLLLGLLPGLGWAYRLLPSQPPLLILTTAAALSYSLTLSSMLMLHYLSLLSQPWPLLLLLNLIALLPLALELRRPTPPPKISLSPPRSLGLILLMALALRLINLGYSEFQGDEALAMLSAAEALSGHADALFLRAKGPAEVLLPMAMWQLNGLITETAARLPFSMAAMGAILTIYLLGQRLNSADTRLGWLAAGFFAFNGFMVAFGRIVQYQAVVVWMSALAVLLLDEWQRRGQLRLAALSGLFLGSGLLAHYDAILVLPALLWLLLMTPQRPILHRGAALLTLLLSMLLPTLPFYLPYLLDPQAGRTGDYVGGRIGNELRNNLPDFFQFNSFYSSFYTLALTSMLVLGLLSWLIWRRGGPFRGLAALLLLGVGAVVVWPTALAWPPLDLSFIPFAALILLAIFSLSRGSLPQIVLIWLAVPFLGYNFVVALGLTHIYTIVPAWALLAAWATHQLLASQRAAWLPPTLFFLLCSLFLANAFVRHDVEYWQDYPAGNLSLFWTPYDEPPAAGFFGFAHRTGWKAVGQQIANGTLTGDYGSNEEPDVTTWYTRGAPRACDPQPEFYFLADDLIDPVPVPHDLLETAYAPIGWLTLPNGKGMAIQQLQPTTRDLGDLGALDEATLAQQFDATARPAAFARTAEVAMPVQVNFGGQIQLLGYDVDTRRATAGGRLPVTLYWQALHDLSSSYHVFVQLLNNETGGVVAQADGVPVCWTFPTNRWRAGQIIADQHALMLPMELPPGSYTLHTGLYHPADLVRLDWLDVAGNPAGTSYPLTKLSVQ